MTIGHTISTKVTTPIILSAANNPLTVTKTGSIVILGMPPYGNSEPDITGPANINGDITNKGSLIVSGQGVAIDLIGSGTITNSGFIEGGGNANPSFGVFQSIEIGGYGVISNTGTIDGTIGLGGGSINNGPGGFINGIHTTAIVSGSPITLTNSGSILGEGEGGVDLEDGGTIINKGDIGGPQSNAISVGGGNGVIENYGNIIGTVAFGPNVASALFVDEPGSTSSYDVISQSASSTLELAKGNGTVSGIGTEFTGFTNLNVDKGGIWTLTGTNSTPTILNDGTTIINGSLDVTAAVDPTSTGIFQLTGNSTLDLASATGSATKISFMGSDDRLDIDNASLFGTKVGTANYAGSLLEAFTKGDVIDIKDFAVTGLTDTYKAGTGLLQISNGSQEATLHFQNSSLGGGSFKTVTDGSGGVLITHS